MGCLMSGLKNLFDFFPSNLAQPHPTKLSPVAQIFLINGPEPTKLSPFVKCFLKINRLWATGPNTWTNQPKPKIQFSVFNGFQSVLISDLKLRFGFRFGFFYPNPNRTERCSPLTLILFFNLHIFAKWILPYLLCILRHLVC